ncbi:hypothetical protein KJ951_01320 [Patescibacteria group bacterium]|nr:hypothetical protein [Patescibacteria group bacterium]MBU1703020.1 hypothetical protein [Patescibacteria group bacterium]
MATLILKSLAIGYFLVAFIGGFILNPSGENFLLIVALLPILLWQITLIVVILTWLILKAIEEHK